MMDKRVSIIVPVYNCEGYIKKCFNSIKLQSYKNIEVIMINDGSTDRSGLICADYARKDERFKVINQANSGPGVARNIGLNNITGQYIVYIDADDYVSSEYIETMINLMEKYEADIVEVGSIRMFPKGNQIFDDKSCVVYDGCEQLIKDYFSNDRKLQNTLWGRLFRRKIIEDIRFSEASIAEDSEYSLKALARCSRLVKYNKALYVYRAYHDSVTRKKLYTKNFDIIDVALRDMRFLETINVEPNNWQEIADSFSHTVYGLLERIAIEKQEDNFNEELANIKTVYGEVSKLVQRHNAKIDDGILSAVDNIVFWTDEYRKKNRAQIIKKRMRRIVHRCLASYKTYINYEYSF